MRAVGLHVAVAAIAAALAGCGGGGDGGATSQRAARPAPSGVPITPRSRHGAKLVAESGCLGCHDLFGAGNRGPGPDLSRIGARLTRAQIEAALIDPPSPMPPYVVLLRRHPREFHALAGFLASLK